MEDHADRIERMCPHCNGKGHVIGIPSIKCRYCRGTGTEILENVRRCKYCGEWTKGYCCLPCYKEFER